MDSLCHSEQKSIWGQPCSTRSFPSIFKDSAFRLESLLLLPCFLFLLLLLLFQEFCVQDSVKTAQPNSTKLHRWIGLNEISWWRAFGFIWSHTLTPRRAQIKRGWHAIFFKNATRDLKLFLKDAQCQCKQKVCWDKICSFPGLAAILNFPVYLKNNEHLLLRILQQ